ncbi:MAG: urate oxidase, partial [Actinomycetota bacterium]|nr:urate oxidase [Actinomycetota bacterium]
RHFVDDTEPVELAQVEIEEYQWERITVAGAEHNHSWVRKGQETRTTVVTVDGKGGPVSVVSGLKDLVLLKSTGSEFHGFLEDRYTTLVPTHDRIMSTSLVARWRYTATDLDWGKTYADIRQILLEKFADVHSLALQQTLYEMGKAVLEAHDAVAEIKFSAPNKHHFVYDLSPFDLDNPNEVFQVGDRPYGLIEATVLRDDAPPAGLAWDTVPGFC